MKKLLQAIPKFRWADMCQYRSTYAYIISVALDIIEDVETGSNNTEIIYLSELIKRVGLAYTPRNNIKNLIVRTNNENR